MYLFVHTLASLVCVCRMEDIDGWITRLTVNVGSVIPLIPEFEFRRLCRRFKSILLEEDCVPIVSLPAILVGDLHGQYYDVLEMLRVARDGQGTGCLLEGHNYVFMGDYVDRGYNSIETWQLLMLLKIRYPHRVTLLRGNHESRQVSQVYGLYDEIVSKFGNPSVWKDCTDAFDYLPLASVIGGKIFAVHGGLSPELSHIDQIRQIDRINELPNEGQFADLMWSDPEDSVIDWAANPRGAGWVFGLNPTRQFLHLNNLQLIARAHQLVQEGYKYQFDSQLVTVWSAPNYCYRCGNVASVLTVSNDGTADFKIFKETRQESLTRQAVPYFV